MKNNSLLKGNAIFEKYIRKNFLKYIIILAIYLIGFLIGITIFNENITNVESAEHISQYVSERIEIIGMKTTAALSGYIKQDFLELLIISILSFSIVGVPVILFLFFIDSVSMGITISALIHTSGIGSGLSFSILIFMVPAIIRVFIILMMICSSLKFTENILKYKKEFKYEIVRHAFVNLIAFFAICVVALYRTFSLNIVNQILY